MIFTGYSLLAYFIENNSKSPFEEKDYPLLFIKESEITSKNYTYSLGKIIDDKFERELFIKQSKNFNSDSLLSLNTENEVYDHLKNNTGVFPFLVEKIHFDIHKNLLILKYYNIKEENFLSTYTPNSSASLAQKLSTILAEFHSALLLEVDKENPYFLQVKPRILYLTKDELINNENIRKINSTIKITSNLRSKRNVDMLNSVLPHLSAIEFKQDTVIHNDIRIENFLKNESDIKLIDWELACWGDKYWDMACLFAMFLQKTDNEQWRAYTKNALKIIWQNYHQVRQLSYTDSDLRKIIQFIGIKAIETRLEKEGADIESIFVDMIISPETVVYNNINIWETIQTAKAS